VAPLDSPIDSKGKRLRADAPRPSEWSVAVLPFHNATGDDENDYLVDGFTERVISELSLIRDFRVIARSAAFRHKGSRKDQCSIGRSLGVDCIVVGTLSQRAAALIIDAALHVRPGRAIAADSRYALACCGLSDCYSLCAFLGLEAPDAVLPKAQEAARTALDPVSPIIATDLAWNWYMARDFEGARSKAIDALDLQPGFAPALFTLGLACEQLGRYEQGLEAFRAAAIHSQNPAVLASEAHLLTVMGRCDEAVLRRARLAGARVHPARRVAGVAEK
jgi:TolB-like protein